MGEIKPFLTLDHRHLERKFFLRFFISFESCLVFHYSKITLKRNSTVLNCVFINLNMDNPTSAPSNVHPIVFSPHKAGKPLRSSAKIIVMNVFCKLRTQHAESSETEVIRMVSNLTGVSTSSIFRMKDEFHRSGIILCRQKSKYTPDLATRQSPTE